MGPFSRLLVGAISQFRPTQVRPDGATTISEEGDTLPIVALFGYDWVVSDCYCIAWVFLGGVLDGYISAVNFLYIEIWF